jgi:ankyrin repeat protein
LPRETGASLLHLSLAAEPHSQLVNYLLEKIRLDINHQAEYGDGGLTKCVTESLETKSTCAIIETLIRKGADVNLLDKQESGSILIATKSTKKKFLEILVNTKGANPNIVNKENQTPLIYFASKRDLGGVQLLLDNKNQNIDVNF